jgi:2'-5' RNA ligase
MRAFIAIELSDEMRSGLAQVQSHLKYSGADVKWVEEDNIHLTLKFLGDIDEKKCAQIKNILDEISAAIKPFEINIKDIGAFPKIEFPRVIWAGLDKGAKESSEIAKKLDEGLSKIGFEKESRPFVAHVTIGRVRSAKNKATLKEKIETLGGLGVRNKGKIVNSIALFQSTLTPSGSIYAKLHEAKFRS